MGRVYFSRIVGDGSERSLATPAGNPYRSKAVDLMKTRGLPGERVRTFAIPTGADGRPTRLWSLCEVWASSFTTFDADGDMVLLADRLNLGQSPNNTRRNAINNRLSQLGVTTRAVAGDTYRVIANKLLTELGSEVRL